MAEISFMRRLTLAILVALVLFGVVLVFVTGLIIAVNGIAVSYGVPVPFPQPYFELMIAFSVALIPIADVVWDSIKIKEKEA